MRMPLACVLGVTAFFFVVQGCSKAAAPPPSAEETGDDTPGDDDDATETPTVDAGGTPTETPPTDTKDGSTTPVTPAPEPPKPKSSMTFFVTSVAAGTGGNLGGLDGADKKCKELAAAAPIKGDDHTWAAYLSVAGTNAKDRIGPGPWQNQKGKVIATTVAELHKVDLALGPDLLDEKGAAVPDNARYIFTGSKLDGTIAIGNPNQNSCSGWTNGTNQQAGVVGDGQYTPQKNLNFGAAWNHAALDPANARINCAPQQGKSQGRIYCFAKD